MGCETGPKILVVDYLSASKTGLSFELSRASENARPPVLKMFDGPATRNHNRLLRCVLHSSPALAVETFLRAFSQVSVLSETTVVFGAAQDPLSPFEERLANTLKVLELLAGAGFQEVILQTRSPLALLAAPVLQGLGARAQITMGLEMTDDSLAAKATPHLPKPSERIAALHALHSAGICCSFQTAPVTSSEPGQSDIPELARFVLETPCAVHVINPTRILSGRGAQASVAERRLVRFMRSDGHRLLQNETARLEREPERKTDRAA